MVNINIEKLLCHLLKHNKQGYFDGDNIIDALKEQDIEYTDGKLEYIQFKPKYNVGDWVVFNCGDRREICKISEVRNTSKVYMFSDDTYLGFHQEDMLEKWSIDKAKPGDILYLDGFGTEYYLFILNNIGEDGHIDTYCRYYSEDGSLYINSLNLCNVKGNDDIEQLRPATNEEIVKLLSKLESDGYKWNETELKIEKSKPDEDEIKTNKFKVGDLIHHVSDSSDVVKVVKVLDNGNIEVESGVGNECVFTIFKSEFDYWVLHDGVVEENNVNIESMVEQYKTKNFIAPFGDRTHFDNYVNAMASAYRQGLMDMYNKCSI